MQCYQVKGDRIYPIVCGSTWANVPVVLVESCKPGVNGMLCVELNQGKITCPALIVNNNVFAVVPEFELVLHVKENKLRNEQRRRAQ